MIQANAMKGHRFDETEEIQANAKKQMKDIAKTGYLRCFCHWQEHWNSAYNQQETTLKEIKQAEKSTHSEKFNVSV